MGSAFRPMTIHSSNTELSSIYSIPSDEFRPSVLAALDTKRKEAEYKDIERYRYLIMENIEYMSSSAH